MIIVILTIVTVISGAIGTLTGFGISTLMVPVVLIFFPLPQTLLLVGVIHWFGNIWKMVLFKKGINWKIILAFGVPGVIASFFGAQIVLTTPEHVLLRVLGGLLMVYAIALLYKQKLRVPKSHPVAVTGGALSGLMAGIFGIGGAIRSAFLAAFNLEKSVYIATSGAIGLAIDSTRIVTYVASGIRLERDVLISLLVLIPASFVGATLAKRISLGMPKGKFRNVVLIFLLLIGMKLLIIP
jgi:uncharacterized protein